MPDSSFHGKGKNDYRFLVTFHHASLTGSDVGIEEGTRELQKIKDSGFDGVRTTPEPHFKDCERLGLVQLGEIYFPDSLARVGPDGWARRVNGGPGKIPYRDHTFCAGNPEIVKAGEEGVRAEIGKYQDSGVLVAFVIDNEFSYLDLEDTTQYLCYCPACVGNFRSYIQGRFKAISELNARWRTNYRDWDEIALPIKEYRRPWRKKEALPAWVEFRRFTNQAIACYVNRLAGAAREVTGKPIVIAEMNTMFFDGCVHVAQDLYSMSREADVLGLNIGGCDFAEIIDLARGFGRTIWLTESHIETAILNSRLMRQRHYSAIAHGCRTISFFKSRASHEGIERDMFGITREDGRPVQLFFEVKQITGEFKKLSPKLEPTQHYQPRVGIVYSWETMFVNDYFERTLGGRGLEMPAISALHGAYQAVRSLHVPVEAVTTDQMEVESFDKYETLILPACIAFPRSLAGKLIDWVASGGTLIADYPFSRYDEGGVMNPHEPGGGFEALGIETASFTPSGLHELATESLTFPAVGERGRIIRHRGDVLGTFKNGEPAIIRTRVGDGQCIFFGASPAIGMKNYSSSSFPEFIRRFLPRPPVSIDLPLAISREIDLGLLQADGHAILILVNYNDAAVSDVSIRVEVSVLGEAVSEIWLYDQDLEKRVQLPDCRKAGESGQYLLLEVPELDTTRVIEFL